MIDVARALDQVKTWPATTVAAAVVSAREGEPRVIDWEGSMDVPLRWASVTKVATALAVLVASEEGTVDLDEPCGPPGSTVRHLLAHASGLATDDDRVLSAPGRRRIYSNFGFDLLARHVATQSGVPFGVYLDEAVLSPLGMTSTTLEGSPASGMSGPLADLALLARELLSPQAIAPATLAEATRVAFPGLSGVLPGFGHQSPNDWGLGLEIRDSKHPHWTGGLCSESTFGHFGRSGSFIWVDPDRNLACVSLSDHDFGAWAALRWPRLADAVLTENLAETRLLNPEHHQDQEAYRS